MSDDLLAEGAEAPATDDNQATEEQATEAPETTETEVQAGPPPSDTQYPEWVPSEFKSPEKRGELFNALGLKEGQVLPNERPEFIPEKFWGDDGLQLDKMAQSYTELERRLSSGDKAAPEVPEQYEVRLPEGVDLGEDAEPLSEEDQALFKELGLNNEGAQKLTEHFWNSVMPVLAEKQTELETQKVASEWGLQPDSEEYKQRLGQVRHWAESNLPEEVTSHLRKSASGVQAMWSMMQNKVAPASSDSAVAGKTDAELQQMIQDPKYWDPANEHFRNEVQKEYQKRFGT